jgi:hypothetical protein
VSRDSGETLTFTLKLVALVILVMWASSFIPDQRWMFDQTPICSDADAGLVTDGGIVRCVSP